MRKQLIDINIYDNILLWIVRFVVVLKLWFQTPVQTFGEVEFGEEEDV
jgi:hypothetical protein